MDNESRIERLEEILNPRPPSSELKKALEDLGEGIKEKYPGISEEEKETLRGHVRQYYGHKQSSWPEGFAKQ